MDESAGPDAAAMAEAMGFSAFGAQNPHKKRRYNPSADASSSTTPKPAAAVPTGGNAAPLGASKPSVGSANAHANEIDLNNEDDNADDAGGVGSRPSQLQPIAGLPARPAASAGFVADAHQPRGQTRRDDPNRPPWYEGYYDRSSNENPWERLEKELNLQPKGSWIARQAQQQTAS